MFRDAERGSTLETVTENTRTGKTLLPILNKSDFSPATRGLPLDTRSPL